jgi:molybdenum cofactor biosynthesis protein B
MIPHPDTTPQSIICAIITISDTRTPETDTSGQYIQDSLKAANHQIIDYQIIPDESEQIRDKLIALASNKAVEAIILNGGTGIAPRDTTYDTLILLLEKTLDGFGEIFRYLSYQEIGSRAIASRAIAGVYHHKLVFSVPGSSKAVKLAMDQLILPELIHLVKQTKQLRCN